MEFNPEVFDIQAGVIHWVTVVGILSAFFLLLAFLVALVRDGARGPEKFGLALIGTGRDLVSTSPRRVMAIASLTFKEAIRRKALFVFVVFCILFMFAGWFLARGGDKPQLQVKMHVYFVLTAITWFVLSLMLLISCWGIPEDIRLRSLHTVVTKPTRRIEIVLGRVLGFTSIGMLVLVVMGVSGYVWIQRQLTEREKAVLTCRVPIYGELEFLSAAGQPEESGINVGDVWKFRSYIAGATRARAIWTFQDVTARNTGGDELILESNFEAFRTFKGNMDLGGLIAQYTLVNNRRAEAFAPLAASNNFRAAADELRLGRYQNAADGLRLLGNKLLANRVEFVRGELEDLANGFENAARVIDGLETARGQDWVIDVIGAFSRCQTDASDAAAMGLAAADFSLLGESVLELAEKVETHQDAMREHLSRLAVPLPSFVVREYRFGENVMSVPRELTFVANDEDIARFVTRHVSSLSEQGLLTDGDALVEDLSDRLAESEVLNVQNADQVARVLRQLVRGEDLKVENGRLVPAQEGRTLFQLMHRVVADGRLSAADSWELTADLYDDLIHDGQLRVEVACLSAAQYLGMAKPDLFIRLPDRPFASGYFKALGVIAMLMMLIVTMGVASSCFVKGPVSIFLTLTLLMIGQPVAYEFMESLVDKQVEGGGFVESLIRMGTQQNQQAPLGLNENVEKLIKFVDEEVIFGGLRMVKNIVPQLGVYTEGRRFVENGFDVPWGSCLLPALFTLLGFVIPCVLIGFVSLRFRELEAK